MFVLSASAWFMCSLNQFIKWHVKMRRKRSNPCLPLLNVVCMSPYSAAPCFAAWALKSVFKCSKSRWPVYCSHFTTVPNRGSFHSSWPWSATAPSATTTSGTAGPRSWAAVTPWCATSNMTRSSSSDTSAAGWRWVTHATKVMVDGHLP